MAASTEEPGAWSVSGSLSRQVVDLRRAWSPTEMARFAAEHQLWSVGLMHVGGDGGLKVLDFVARSEGHLVDILEGGERADASSLFPELRGPGRRSDVMLRPRIETAFVDPFAPRPALAVLCGHVQPDGSALPVSPDTIVRLAASRVHADTGIDLWAHGEVEFFVGRPVADGDVAAASDDAYQAAAPLVFGERFRRRAHALLTEMGVPVKYAHSEVGHIPPSAPGDLVWEQHEVELALAPLPEAADAVLLTRWVLGRLAHEAGWACSFDPIVTVGHAGNGLHFHFSPVRDGRHLPCLAAGEEITEEGGWLVGGLVLTAAGLMAFGNRHPRSFDRLTGGREVPQRIAWGISDRQALVRIPVVPQTPDGRQTAPPTVELRLPDGAAQPHFLLAGAAAAFLRGRAVPDLQRLLAGTRSGGVAPLARPLPANTAEIAAALDADCAVYTGPGIFPESMIDRTVARLLDRHGSERLI
jgi:glutamine synthetase